MKIVIEKSGTMTTEKYITIPELAKLLGVSRIAIYNRVKKGQIPAAKIGRTYVITDKTVADILGRKVTAQGKKRIDAAVDRTVREYGEVLKRLAKE
jgi:excisionase family DNA binding protein